MNHSMSTTETSTEVLQLGTHPFTSRLIVGTGKYADYDLDGRSRSSAAAPSASRSPSAASG